MNFYVKLGVALLGLDAMIFIYVFLVRFLFMSGGKP